MPINELKLIYFVGIGGIGMSSLARYFNERGVTIFGYDRTETDLTKALEAEGMNIHYVDDISLLPQQIDLVVYTPAIPSEHSELQFLKKQNLPILKRSQILGWISRTKKTIAVAGTHGKTTTSSIIAHLLKSGGVDCTAFLGGISNNFHSNYVSGTSDWVVVEADEYDRSFLQLFPDIAIINSLDADHLDIYGSHEAMLATYAQFANQLKPDGILYIHESIEEKLAPILDKNVKYETFGTNYGNFYAKNLKTRKGFIIFDLEKKDFRVNEILFTLPGKHNVENAIVAIAVALQLGVSTDNIISALSTFEGIKRRFDFIIRNDAFVYIDDYAHHPTELQAAIATARMLYPDKKLTGIFQPHLFSRTRDFVEGFAGSLDSLDEPILLEIYPARELPIEGVSSKIIFDKMKNPNKKMIQKAELMNYLSQNTFEVLMTLGAGDVDVFVNKIKTLYADKLEA
ncbi:MAG: UDP-N-acetylmuramate--L-alanine ligase [Saprospiraceae bacterium]|nr:UDP-N-acetylmuramate--L-alanine ligase [Saprospiraceae bacterium]